MADVAEQVSVRLDANQKEIFDRLQAKYPATPRGGLFLQLLYEWDWAQEAGNNKGARLERIEAELAEVKAMVKELYEARK